MTTQKPISKSPISDAFLSKNAEGNYLSNGCFCARCKNITSFPFTGKELDAETGFSYFGARYLDHTLTTAWMSVDPMADKYPSISPYAYCAWNPVKLVDPDGDKILISGYIYYTPGMSSADYTGFERQTIDALNLIYSTKEGFIMISLLYEHNNEVDINPGTSTEFTVDAPESFFYDTKNHKQGSGVGYDVSVSWNADEPEKVCTLNGMCANATYNLLDEICHAYDLFTGFAFNPENGDDIFGDNYSKNEIQAVYRSNVVRHQLKDDNYRCHYYNNRDDTQGVGPKTADKIRKKNVFYQPSWYQQCETDDVSWLSSEFD